MPILYTFLASLSGSISFIWMLLYLHSPKPRHRTEKEAYYKDAQSDQKKLPSIFDNASVKLSCIVPAYNESQRLPTMLEETVGFLEKRRREDDSLTYEILVVDDGSTDSTVDVALKFARERKTSEIRVVTLERNRGKGGAVTMGMLSARGEYCLMVDADGATQFKDLEKLEKALVKITQNEHGIAIGSRSHLVATDAVVKRSFVRNFLMRCFHALVYALGIHGIKDTQCGFKLFTRKTAQLIFSNMHVERWIFDVECLLIAQSQNIPIQEVQVTWHEIDGSKVNLMVDSVQMAKDLFLIRLNYILRRWKVDPHKSIKSQ